MPSHLAALFAVPFFGAVLAAQTTWVVTGGLSGLQTAINNAAPGDILDVMPGFYWSVTCTKGIRIALRPGAEVGSLSSPTVSMQIASVPAQATCVVTGGKVFGISISQCAGTVVVDGVIVEYFTANTPMAIQGCSGPVVFDGVNHHSGGGALARGHIQIANCAQVSFTTCQPAYMTVANSSVSLTDSFLSPFGVGMGLHQQSGNVTVNGGRITGAPVPWFVPMAPGIRLDQGTLTLAGGAIIEPSPVPGGPIAQAPGILTTGGAIRRDPSVVVLSLGITGPASINTTPVPSLAVTHAATTMNVTVRGEPGSAVVTFAGLPIPAYATPWGEAWLLPTDPILNVTLMPLTWTSTFTHSFAAVPPFFALVLQPVALRPNGNLVVGAPVRFAWN